MDNELVIGQWYEITHDRTVTRYLAVPRHSHSVVLLNRNGFSFPVFEGEPVHVPCCDSFDWVHTPLVVNPIAKDDTESQPPITLGSVWRIPGYDDYRVSIRNNSFVALGCTEKERNKQGFSFSKTVIDDVFDNQSRRFIRQDPITSDVVDPGEGWRLLDKTTEKSRFSDEWLDLKDIRNGWKTRHDNGGNSSWFYRPTALYRRRVEPAHDFKVGEYVQTTKGSLCKITEVKGDVLTVLGIGGDEVEYKTRYVLKTNYRPFADAKEFEPYRDRWIGIGALGHRRRVVFYNNTGVWLADNLSGSIFVDWGYLLIKYLFDGESPCGVMEHTNASAVSAVIAAEN